MNDEERGKELQKRIKDVNPVRVDAYQRLFDRILLYQLAINTLPAEKLEELVDFTDIVVKRSINEDAILRTIFMEETKNGRVAKMNKEQDGEDLRLEHINIWNVAKDVIRGNLQLNR